MLYCSVKGKVGFAWEIFLFTNNASAAIFRPRRRLTVANGVRAASIFRPRRRLAVANGVRAASIFRRHRCVADTDDCIPASWLQYGLPLKLAPFLCGPAAAVLSRYLPQA